MKATHVPTVRGKLARALLMLSAVPALMLGTVVSPASADPGNSGDDACTTGTYSGNTTNGSWHRTYNPGCTGTTIATVDINWSNTQDSNGHHHIVWDASISASGISQNKCVYVVLDWHNPAMEAAGHVDAQFLRNCDENSVANMTAQSIDTQSYAQSYPWYVQQMQIGVFNPNNCSGITCATTSRVCPGAAGAPALTDTDGECTGYLQNGAAQMVSKGAKIYRRVDGGASDQNQPLWPAHYGTDELTSPDL